MSSTMTLILGIMIGTVFGVILTFVASGPIWLRLRKDLWLMTQGYNRLALFLSKQFPKVFEKLRETDWDVRVGEDHVRFMAMVCTESIADSGEWFNDHFTDTPYYKYDPQWDKKGEAGPIEIKYKPTDDDQVPAVVSSEFEQAIEEIDAATFEEEFMEIFRQDPDEPPKPKKAKRRFDMDDFKRHSTN
jgi:hypothetical protein